MVTALTQGNIVRACVLVESLQADISAKYYDGSTPSGRIQNSPVHQRYIVEALRRLSRSDLSLLADTWIGWNDFDETGVWIESIFVRLGLPVGFQSDSLSR